MRRKSSLPSLCRGLALVLGGPEAHAPLCWVPALGAHFSVPQFLLYGVDSEHSHLRLELSNAYDVSTWYLE